MPIFSFLYDNFCKCEGILKEIWFGIANGQILSMLTELSAQSNTIMAGYYSSRFLLIQYYYFSEKNKTWHFM